MHKGRVLTMSARDQTKIIYSVCRTNFTMLVYNKKNNDIIINTEIKTQYNLCDLAEHEPVFVTTPERYVNVFRSLYFYKKKKLVVKHHE